MSEPSLGAEVERFFRERLPVLPGFEDRPQQRQMALAVARAFEDEEILVAEAGTGTGKSLAYLVPALLWRARGGPEPVVVARKCRGSEMAVLTVGPLSPFRTDFTSVPAGALVASRKVLAKSKSRAT